MLFVREVEKKPYKCHYNTYQYHRHTAIMNMRDDVIKVPEGQSVAIQFNTPSLIILHGQTNTGKTELTYKIMTHCDSIFSNKIAHIVFSYSTHQPIYDVMAKNIKNLTFIKGLPTEDYLKEVRESVPKDDHILLILDDQQASLDSPTMMRIATELNHHLKITTLLILHNIFGTGRFSRTILLQTSYYISMRNLRDQSQLAVLSRQIFGNGCSNVINKAFDKLCKISDRPYLVTDLHPHSKYDSLRLRSFVLPGEDMIVFKVQKP